MHSTGQLRIEPAQVSRKVQQKFMEACASSEGELIPTYHGSEEKNYSSICSKGLLIPGKGNDLSVVHGAVHGRGIYTARVNAPSLSMGFCSAPKMLICGVVDNADLLTQRRTVDGRVITAESNAVRHVGDAVVVFDDRRVAPLFEVSAEKFSPYQRVPQAVSAVIVTGPGVAPLNKGPQPQKTPPS